MITPDGKLNVFETFVVDTTLPKHKERNQGNFSVSADDFRIVQGNGIVVRATGSTFTVTQSTSWWSRLITWVVGLFRQVLRRERPTLTIEQFFTSVKLNQKELVLVQQRAEGYEKALMNAKRLGQHAFVEQLTDGLNAARMEAHCEALGVTKYLEEADVVRFYKQCKRGLRLDWIRNFTRPIPTDLAERKFRADELGLFDNYVILHYDPEAKSYAETQAEKDAKRDPILFGLMRGRRVLYVIGDWIDEVCDLTLDQLADAIGKDAVKTLGPPKRTP